MSFHPFCSQFLPPDAEAVSCDIAGPVALRFVHIEKLFERHQFNSAP
jgi:hypothetical protein